MSPTTTARRFLRHPRDPCQGPGGRAYAGVAVACLIALLGLSLDASCARAQRAPAGADIVNRADAEYVDTGSGGRALSNQVHTRVLAVYAISLRPPGTVAAPAYVLRGAAGDTVVCRFTVDNLGNASDSVAVSQSTVPPSTVVPAAVRFFLDADGDGHLDPGEDDRSFLALAAGTGTPLDLAVVLPPDSAGGDAYVEVEARSSSDALAPPERSVVHIVDTGAPVNPLFLGPDGNPRALPGGEGSADDLLVERLGYSDSLHVFTEQVLNAGTDPLAVEVGRTGAAPPAGVRVVLADSTGAPLTPSRPRWAALGTLAPGESRRFQVRVGAVSGAPLYRVLGGDVMLHLVARASTDTLVTNATRAEALVPARVDPAAALAIRQTFRQPRASNGDIVTLVVTVENLTDSLRIDDVTVGEFVQPQLDFASSADFAWDGSSLHWRAGTLAGGESRKGTAKFVVNSRAARATAHAVGRADGRAASDQRVTAGPATSALRIDSDVFGDEGIVLGDVFVDTDGDGRREPGEVGVPGAAVTLDNGDYAVADSLGVFSIPRVFPGYRMVRLDERSLPDSLALPDLQQAGPHAGRPNERLVHLLPSGHARVSFPVRRREVAPPPPPPPAAAAGVDVQEKVSISRRAPEVPAVRLSSSYFALGRAELAVGAAGRLAPIAAFLRAHPDWGVLLEGHTDSTPIHTAQFPSNVELSLARAGAVADALAVQGVDPEHVVVRGYGATRPVATNDTVGGRRQNRRVDVTFIPPGASPDSTGAATRIGAPFPNAAAAPDTFRVAVFWTITTDAEPPAAARLRLHAPGRAAVAVHVPSGPLARDADGTYHVPAFGRGRPLKCSVTYATLDTSTIADDVTARLSAQGAGGGNDILIRPFAAGRSETRTTVSRVGRWSSAPPPASPPGPAPEAGAAGSGRSGGRDVPPRRAVTILDPAADTVFGRTDRIRVRAAMPLGTKTRLLVDGEPVLDERLGERVVDVRRHVETLSWYGVRIRPGWNTLMLESRLIDGSLARDSLRVALASRPATVRAATERVLVDADGRSRGVVRFAVTDGLGLPVADGVVATVVEGAALVDAQDARPDEPGLQVLVSRGEVVLTSRPANDPRRGAVVVACGPDRARAELIYVAPSKPLFATGLVDVHVGAYKARGDGSALGVDNFHDGLSVEGDSRVFVQGPLRDGFSVTARLDSRKRTKDPLLPESVDPDRQYPIYGDASTVHHPAPARGGNYVSVDRGESFVRYGDFRTPFESGEFLAYRRAATGFSSTLARAGERLESFVTKTRFTAHQDELRADGTSGFYFLTRSPVVENSETVVLETRDRFQPENVIDVRPAVRNRDYTVNYFDGSILFKEPVASVDRDFNPVVIVVDYEVDAQKDAQYLYGARGTVGDAHGRHASVTAVARTGAGADYALYGAEGGSAFGPVKVGAEVARSEDDLAGNGNAYKLTAGWDAARTHGEAYVRRVDGEFSNPSLRGGEHELASVKSGFTSRLDLSDAIRFEADGYTHRLDRTGERKGDLRGAAVFRDRLLRVTAGARAARYADATRDDASVLTILGAALGDEHDKGIGTVWEQNLGNETVPDYPNRVKTTATLPWGRRLRWVASHELVAAPGRETGNQLAAGLESRLTRTTSAYTRYSLDRTASDERMGAVMGLRQNVALANGVSATIGVEDYRSLSGATGDDYFSWKTGLSARRPGEDVLESRYEYRWQHTRSKHLVALDGAHQLRSGLAVLTRNVLSVAPDRKAPDALGVKSDLAMAWRPPAGAVQVLAMVRNDYQRHTPVDAAAVTWTLVASGDVNVSLAPQHEVRAKYAYKHVEDWSDHVSLTTDSDLALLQYIYRFAPCWDVDTWGRTVRRRGGGSLQGGAGIEVGRLLFHTLRVAAGYSVNGFDEPDVTGADAWSSGFSVRLQLLISDWMLDELGMAK